MADILIHRCTLRFVRREGWSWGPDPNALVREAVSALRALLEQSLAGMWADDVDGEIVAPLMIQLPVRLSELADAARDDYFTGREPDLHERFRTAVKEALAQARLTPAASRADSPSIAPPRRPRVAEGSRDKLLRLLLPWSRTGTLEWFLGAVARPRSRPGTACSCLTLPGSCLPQ